MRAQSRNLGRGPTTQRHSRPARTQLRCRALFSLFQRGQAKKDNSKQFVEKPAYRASEMRTVAPGVQISPMGLGTWAWGNQFLWGYQEGDDPELQEVFNLVVSRGINLFDTADSYGTGRLNGRSEQLLGRFQKEYPGSARTVGNVHIATKLAAYPWRVLPGNFVAACKGSLRRLKADQVSLAQLHWSTANYAPLQELALQAGLVELYKQGLAKGVGVSNYGPKQLAKIHKYLDKENVPLATAQMQYSLLSYGKAQQEAQAVCEDLGITLISYSPLALGLLSGKYSAEKLPKGPRGTLFQQLLPGATPLLELMADIAEARGKTMSQVAINWCMCQGTVPIPGARTLGQAQEVLGALGWRLSEGEARELTQAARGIKRGMVQNVFQTD